MGRVRLRGHQYAPVHLDAPHVQHPPHICQCYYKDKINNKQHILSCKSMKLMPGNTRYQAKHIPDVCEHSGCKEQPL